MLTKLKSRKPFVRRGVALLIGIASVVGGGLVASASPASAQDNYCYDGQACVWNENDNIVIKTEGDWHGKYWMGHGWILNLGLPHPGADYLRATVDSYYLNNPWEICLPIPERGNPWAQPDASNWYITDLEWGGPCASWELGWHRP